MEIQKCKTPNQNLVPIKLQLLFNSLETFSVKAKRKHHGWCTEIKKNSLKSVQDFQTVVFLLTLCKPCPAQPSQLHLLYYIVYHQL